MELEILIDSDLGTVMVIDPDELDPNGEPLITEYTIEEWNSLNT